MFLKADPPDCSLDNWGKASYILGTISLVAFMCSSLPQFWKNHKRGSVEGLSIGLLASWFVGDVANVIGTFFTDQLIAQQVIAVYFIISDILIVAQWIYLHGMRKEEEAVTPTSQSPPRPTVRKDYRHLENSSYGSVNSTINTAIITTLSILLVVIPIEAKKHEDFPNVPCDPPPSLSDNQKLVGYIMAWTSALFYCGSRFPQIWENARRKSTDGISLGMFELAVIANISYGLSILFRLPEIDKAFWLGTFPYLVGSLGTLFLDSIIFYQAYKYGDLDAPCCGIYSKERLVRDQEDVANRHWREEQQRPLLSNDW